MVWKIAGAYDKERKNAKNYFVIGCFNAGGRAARTGLGTRVSLVGVLHCQLQSAHAWGGRIDMVKAGVVAHVDLFNPGRRMAQGLLVAFQ